MEQLQSPEKSQRMEEIFVDPTIIRPLGNALMQRFKRPAKDIGRTLFRLSKDPDLRNNENFKRVKTSLKLFNKTTADMQKSKQVKLIPAHKNKEFDDWAFDFSKDKEEKSVIYPGYLSIKPPLSNQLKSAIRDAFFSNTAAISKNTESLQKQRQYEKTSEIGRDLQRIMDATLNVFIFLSYAQYGSTISILTDTRGRPEISFGFEPTNQPPHQRKYNA